MFLLLNRGLPQRTVRESSVMRRSSSLRRIKDENHCLYLLKPLLLRFMDSLPLSFPGPRGLQANSSFTYFDSCTAHASHPR